jgi:hypothetical protein
MESHGMNPLLEMQRLVVHVMLLHGMEHDGLQEELEHNVSPILLMEVHGLRQAMGVLILQPTVMLLHGMERIGLLEEMEQINSSIHQME